MAAERELVPVIRVPKKKEIEAPLKSLEDLDGKGIVKPIPSRWFVK